MVQVKAIAEAAFLRSSGAASRARPAANSNPIKPIAAVTTRPPRRPKSRHAAANGEYISGRSGPCVKKKSRYSIFPSRTRFAAYRYHPSSWFKFPYQTETAASMT